MRKIVVMIAAGVLAPLCLAQAGAAADGKYPDWSGQWARIGNVAFDQTKPTGLGQQTPYTPEMQKRFDAVAANRALGGLENNFSASCVPLGMPRVMLDYEIADIMVTPAATYMWFTESNELRRIFTDGRAWPEKIDPSFIGYSIGEWRDEARTGRYDTLVVETRGFRGPRTYDSSGLFLHDDSQSVIKERFSFPSASPDKFSDVITVNDHALTRPWTVSRSYRRAVKDLWTDTLCALDTAYLILGAENYFISADGYLMPAQKNQKPPDLRFFNNSGK